jgi:hypothetical protein
MNEGGGGVVQYRKKLYGHPDFTSNRLFGGGILMEGLGKSHSAIEQA